MSPVQVMFVHRKEQLEEEPTECVPEGAMYLDSPIKSMSRVGCDSSEMTPWLI